jgi:hypothetical protein
MDRAAAVSYPVRGNQGGDVWPMFNGQWVTVWEQLGTQSRFTRF